MASDDTTQIDRGSDEAPTNAIVPPVVAAPLVGPSVNDIPARQRTHVTTIMHPLVCVTTLALLVALHTICAAFLFACARLYWYATHPYLTYFADLLAPKEDRHFKLVGTALGCIGVLHVLRLVDLILPSALRRWCVRMQPAIVSRTSTAMVTLTTKLTTTVWSHLERYIVHGYERLAAAWLRYKSSRVSDSSSNTHVTPSANSVTGTTNGDHVTWADRVASLATDKVNSTSDVSLANSVNRSDDGLNYSSTGHECCFDVVSVVMELTQIGTQVKQAHRSSHLISRVWINRCYVSIVVLFCWTPLLLHHLLPRNVHAKRTAHFAVDALLNIAYSIVLPLVIFAPYIVDYDPSVYSFSLPLLYGDISATNLVLENQLLFAVSLLDCGSKLVPHVGILYSLYQIGTLTQVARAAVSNEPRRSHRQASRPFSRRSFVMRPQEHQVAPTRPATNTTSHNKSQTSTSNSKNTADSQLGASEQRVVVTDSRCNRAKRFAVASFGAIILAIHVIAQFRSDFSDATVRGCKQTMHPWFTTKCACSEFEFNCYRRSVASPPIDALDFLDTHVLTGIVFSHCTALEMPASLQRFPNLLGIEIYNATLVSWTAAAGISATLHHKMVYTLLCLVNLTALPEGLLGPLPPMLQDIELSLTNLTTLPSDLHERWHSLSVLYIERSLIEAFPPTLLELEVYDLSLIGNRIDRLPELPTRQTNYYVLALSHNPLRELPRELPAELTIDFLGLEGTLIDHDQLHRADWTHTSVNELVWLAGSPACVKQEESADSVWQQSNDPFVCNDVDPRGVGRYPLYLTQPKRKP